MKIYEVDFGRLVALLLPTFLRRPRTRTFLRSAAMQTSRLHGLFRIGRADDLFRESIDSTIPRLEFLLNTMFYPDGLNVAYNRRITLGRTKKTAATNIFLGGVTQAEDEGRPKHLNPLLYVFTGSEAGEINADFAVRVPSEVRFDEARMRAVLKRYALPGKEFEIIKY